MNNAWLATVITSADYLASIDRYPSKAADMWLTALVKTVNWYDRAMWSAVRDLYNGVIGSMEFETQMIDMIQNQMRRAWNEGIRSLGLDPEIDQTMEGEAQLQEIMLSELDYVGPLAQDILDAMHAGDPVEPFHSRVDIWTVRYTDVVNQAVQFYSGLGQKLMWVYGDTAHCTTCEQLDGTVAYASEWEQAGLHPQRPENNMLECGGWRCQCQLIPTDERRSPNALDKLLAIGLG
jgi:hypothetical protein